MSNNTLSIAWYADLTSELKAIKTEGIFNHKWELLCAFHKIGEAICETEKQHNVKITPFLSQLSKDIQINQRDLWSAREFYEKCPDINNVPFGKLATWNRTKKWLSGKLDDNKECPHEETIEIRICAECDKRL